MSDTQIILTFCLLIIILFGIVFTIVSIITSEKYHERKKNCTIKTEGTVKDIKREWIAEMHDPRDYGMCTLFPVVEYKAASKTYRVEYSVGTGKEDKYVIGKKVTVFYNPTNPEHIYLEGDGTEKIVLVFRFVGIGMLVIAAILGITIFS